MSYCKYQVGSWLAKLNLLDSSLQVDIDHQSLHPLGPEEYINIRHSNGVTTNRIHIDTEYTLMPHKLYPAPNKVENLTEV